MVNNTSVTIVITTKNRKSEISNCLTSCAKLNGVSEILVFDDGSSDDTYAFIKNEFPFVNLYRIDNSIGLINARTKCASLAKGDIIFSIDDDCVFDDTETIIEILKYFHNDRIAVVTIPVIDILKSNEITQKGYDSIEDVFISPEFRGCAHAIRKDIFLKLNGYNNNLVRQEEEKELATRLYNQGYIIRVGNCSKPILHYHSVVRNHSQISFYRARNKFIINYLHTPALFLYPELLKQVVSLLIFEFKNRHLFSCIMGFKDAIKNIYQGKVVRNPIPISNYFFLKKLRVTGPIKKKII